QRAARRVSLRAGRRGRGRRRGAAARRGRAPQVGREGGSETDHPRGVTTVRHLLTTLLVLSPTLLHAQQLTWPPTLPGGKSVLSDTSPTLLQPSPTLQKDVAIAKAAPTVDFLYYPGQSREAKLWSAWGDNLAVGDLCYSAIGDHDAPQGHAFL